MAEKTVAVPVSAVKFAVDNLSHHWKCYWGAGSDCNCGLEEAKKAFEKALRESDGKA